MTLLWCREINESEDLKLDVAPGRQKLEIVRRFQILSDTMDDSSITVSSHGDLPTPFSIYVKGNDYADYCVATTCNAKRDKKQPLLWHIEVGYTSAVDVDTSGGQSGQLDLTCYLPSVRNWKISEEVVAQRGRLQLPGETYADAMAKAKVPIVNSVNCRYVDGVTAVKHIRGWEIRRYEWYFNETQAEAYTDVVNADTCWGHPPGTVKMVSITGDWQTVNNTLIWLVVYEFHVCDPGGWGEEILDNGMELWCKADGTWAPTPGDAVGYCHIKDTAGDKISAPVLLDGAGYGGVASSAVIDPHAAPYVATWHLLEEATFANIQPPLPSMNMVSIL